MMQIIEQTQPTKWPKRTILILLVILLLFVTWLGTRGISSEALWFDEVWSYRYAGGTPYGPLSLLQTAEQVVQQSQHERNPPAYYMLLNLWGRITGWTEYAARVLSLLAGLLTVAWTYRLGYDLTVEQDRSTRVITGIGAAVTLGASAFFIEYAREIRAYVFIVLLIAMNLTLYWRILNAPHPPKLAIQAALSLGCAAMLYTHYSTALIFVVLGLYHLLFVPKNARWWRIVVLVVVGVVLFLPWIPLMLKASNTALDTFRTVALSVPEIVRGLAVAFSNDGSALFFLLILVALAARGRHAGLVWFLTAGCLAVAIAINAVLPIIINVRYLILLWPLLALLMGVGIAYLARRGIRPAAVLLIWVVAGTFSSFDLFVTNIPHNVRMPWKTMTAVLQQHIQPDDVVVFHSPWAVWLQGPEFDHYMAGFSNRHSLMESIPGVPDNNAYYTQVGQFLNNAPRVWIGVDQTMQPNFRLADFKRAMADDYVLCYTAFDVREMRFDLYTHTIAQPSIRFGDGIGLTLREPLPAVVKGSLWVLVETSVTNSIPRGTYSIALHVEDETGKLVAQTDWGLPDVPQSCKAETIDITKLSSGTYRLLATVYNWHTGERVSGSAVTGADSPTDRVLLGSFKIQD